MIFSRRNIGEPCSHGRYEWENARFLLDNGIESYEPLCYGEKTAFRIERRSFVVTEELRAGCFCDFVRDKWSVLERQEQQKIIVGIGAVVYRIHDLNVSLPDLHAQHLYLTERADGEYDFAVFDLHRMSRNVSSRNRKLKDLGRLHHSMLDEYFDNDLKGLLVESYAARGSAGDVGDLIVRVERHSD